MDEHQHHGELLNSFFKEQKLIFDSSSQAMYAFLDDGCIVCNEKFATLLGYSSPDEWAKVPETFTTAFVDDAKSRQKIATAYQNAMQKKEGATVNVTWKKKSGGTVETTVILVPISHKGHLFALHFISKKN